MNVDEKEDKEVPPLDLDNFSVPTVVFEPSEGRTWFGDHEFRLIFGDPTVQLQLWIQDFDTQPGVNQFPEMSKFYFFIISAYL